MSFGSFYGVIGFISNIVSCFPEIVYWFALLPLALVLLFNAFRLFIGVAK